MVETPQRVLRSANQEDGVLHMSLHMLHFLRLRLSFHFNKLQSGGRCEVEMLV